MKTPQWSDSQDNYFSKAARVEDKSVVVSLKLTHVTRGPLMVDIDQNKPGNPLRQLQLQQTAPKQRASDLTFSLNVCIVFLSSKPKTADRRLR